MKITHTILGMRKVTVEIEVIQCTAQMVIGWAELTKQFKGLPVAPIHTSCNKEVFVPLFIRTVMGIHGSFETVFHVD